MIPKTLSEKLDFLEQEDDAFEISPYGIRPFYVALEHSIRVKINHLGRWRVVPVRSLTPLSIELLWPLEEVIPDKIEDLLIRIGPLSCAFQNVSVLKVEKNAGQCRVHIGPLNIEETGEFRLQRRKSKRWVCNPEFLPKAKMKNPIFQDEMILFDVLNISSRGLLLKTLLKNKILIRGLELNCVVSFPMIGPSVIDVKVERIDVRIEKGVEFLMLGVSFVSPTQESLELLGQYVVQFCSDSSFKEIEDIEKEGLLTNNIHLGYDFSFAKSTLDYLKISELRKLVDRYIFEEIAVTHLYDISSKVLMVYDNGPLVASLKITSCIDDTNDEFSSFFEKPSDLIDMTTTIEVSRFYVHPKYQRKKLLYLMCHHLILMSIQEKKKFILFVVDVNLSKILKKIGLIDTGISFVSPQVSSYKMSVLFLDIEGISKGEGIGIYSWAMLCSDFSDYVIKSNKIILSYRERIKLIFYKGFSYIVKWWRRLYLNGLC